MLLQTFENPVWTITEVIDFYTVGFLIILFVIYILASNFIEAINDIINFFKSK